MKAQNQKESPWRIDLTKIQGWKIGTFELGSPEWDKLLAGDKGLKQKADRPKRK